MKYDWPILSLMIWAPILGSILVLVIGDVRARVVRWIALAVTIFVFILSIFLYIDFDYHAIQMQYIERAPWVAALSAYYYLGIDGISLPLIILTAFVTVFVIIASWESVRYKISKYMASFLVMEGVMIGVFSALDAVLFYVFWEAMLIPMFLIIGIWGGANRVYATIKFFLYTFFGSVFMLVALIYLYYQANTFEILSYYELKLGIKEQLLIFAAFFLAFAVKIPMFPVHTWLPDAHVEAPTGGSVILAAIMLKIGGYGFLRFSLPITPDASNTLGWLVIGLSLLAIIYIGMVALVQKDLKKLIAYSSIAHMGFVTLGFFLVFLLIGRNGAMMGIHGGMIQMISHGFVSAAMFLCVGVLYDRMHSRQIDDYGGVVNTMPVFAAFFVFFAMSNAGLPGTSGFVGELMVILASFQADFWFAFLAATTLILGAAYTLWMVKRVVFGSVANQQVAALQDINTREFFVMGSMAIAVLSLGLWPEPLVQVMDSSISNLVRHLAVSKL